MELWRQCTHWLIQCRVLPPSHRVTWDGAQVCELAQALRDGVLLCQLLNNLQPHAINLREVNLRPQMSQVSPPRAAGPGWEWGAFQDGLGYCASGLAPQGGICQLRGWLRGLARMGWWWCGW